MKTDVVILAAGKGTRMKSELPKVLTPVAGTSIIDRLLGAAKKLTDRPILVVGHKADQVMKAVGGRARFVLQTEQKGTGHAIAEVLAATGGELNDAFIVMPGDHPLVRPETLAAIAEKHFSSGAKVTIGTLQVPHYNDIYSVFEHYGRVLRDGAGKLLGIREFKDGTPAERAVREVFPSYYCFDTAWLKESIKKLSDDNAAGELYLTDMIGIAIAEGKRVETVALADYSEALGINTPDQKSMIENTLFRMAPVRA